MNKQDYKIHIIGAGVSGLIAARVLEVMVIVRLLLKLQIALVED